MKVEITEKTYEHYKLIMFYFRFTGLFPVKVLRDGSKLFLQFSHFYLIFWWIFGGTSIVIAYRGIILDSESQDISNRLEANTDKLMFLLQLTEYSAIFFVGLFINPCRFRILFGYIDCINKVDSIIKTTHKKSEKFKLLVIPILFVTYNSVYSWIYLNAVYEMFKDSLGLIEILSRYMGASTVSYFAWAAEYMNFVILKSLETRIRRLNHLLSLEYQILLDRDCFGENKRDLASRNLRVRMMNGAVTIARISYIEDEAVVRLRRAWLLLMDSIDILNDFLGLSFLVTTVGVFFALIYAVYFFMLDMGLDRGDVDNIGELYLILLQLGAHTMRALMIINPAYTNLIQMEETKGLVCKMLSCNLSPRYRKQVEAFVVILGLRELQFSSCEFFVVDRVLFTSLVDTITTILMVFYQYRNDIQIDF